MQKLIILRHKPNENEVRKKAHLQREEFITIDKAIMGLIRQFLQLQHTDRAIPNMSFQTVEVPLAGLFILG